MAGIPCYDPAMKDTPAKPPPSGAYVVKPDAAGWVVISPGNAQLNGVYPTREQALQAARSSVQVSGGEIRLMRRNGKIIERFTLGRSTAGVLNALEGIGRSSESRDREQAFDSKGLSPTQRRRAIVEAYRAKR